MQALFLFVMYGLFFAIMSSFVQVGSLSAIEKKQANIDGVKEFFQNIDKAYNGTVITHFSRVPNLGKDIANYLLYEDIKTSVNWYFSDSLDEDPWGKAFKGYALHKLVPVSAQTGGNASVFLPITAFVLASSGPDRSFDKDFLGSLNKISASSELRDVMRLEATKDTDDIVYTFSTQGSMNNQWARVVGYVGKIAQAVFRQYLDANHKFTEDLMSVYGEDYIQFYTDGKLNNTAANRAKWKADGVTATVPSLVTFQDLKQLGVYDAIDFIQQERSLKVTIKGYNATAGIGSGLVNQRCGGANLVNADAFRVCITNNGSSWGKSGDLFYYQDVNIYK